MISSVTNSGLFGATAGSTAPKKSLDKDAFMTLLVTQLKNQDPMNPSDSSQLAAQLAQFTTVEQLSQLNEAVTSQELSLREATLLSKTSLSAALIGRRVIAEGNEVNIPTTGAAQIRIEVGAGGGQAKLRLLDSGGREVATRDLGVVPAGRQTITLPADLPAGTYHYEVTVTGARDTQVAVATFTRGIVDGVSFKNGQIVLRIGGMEVALDDLAEIEPESALTSVAAGT
jgi:flagellar basal-body rod modification protein FlgD